MNSEWTKFPNYLFEIIANGDLTKNDMKLLTCIVRQSKGFESLSQYSFQGSLHKLSKLAGLSWLQTRESLKRLTGKALVTTSVIKKISQKMTNPKQTNLTVKICTQNEDISKDDTENPKKISEKLTNRLVNNKPIPDQSKNDQSISQKMTNPPPGPANDIKPSGDHKETLKERKEKETSETKETPVDDKFNIDLHRLKSRSLDTVFEKVNWSAIEKFMVKYDRLKMEEKLGFDAYTYCYTKLKGLIEKAEGGYEIKSPSGLYLDVLNNGLKGEGK